MTMREAFEKYAADIGWPLELADNGPYLWGTTDSHWCAWQAAYAAGMERAAEIAVGHYTVWDEGVTAGNEIADAIRAEIKEQA